MTLPKLHEEIVAGTDSGNDTVVVIDDVSSSVPDSINAASGDNDEGQADMLCETSDEDLCQLVATYETRIGGEYTGGSGTTPGDDAAEDFNI